jgi:hypothetical protein
MSDNVITFPEQTGLFPKRKPFVATAEPEEKGPNLQRLLFRSSSLIVESNEADLVRDVCIDIDRAQTKRSASKND